MLYILCRSKLLYTQYNHLYASSIHPLKSPMICGGTLPQPVTVSCLRQADCDPPKPIHTDVRIR